MEVMKVQAGRHLERGKQNDEASTLAKDKRQKEKKILEELRGNFYFLSNYNFFNRLIKEF